MRLGLAILMTTLACGPVCSLPAADAGLIKINGAIGPATAGYISRAIDVAGARSDVCLIVQLDTPGGLLDSTKEIVQKFYASSVPIVVYVAPAGANAASAGCFITMAADIAAMAPDTTIGAAHPVSAGMGGGGNEESTNSVMKQKLESYASSYIESIAERRGRNVEWARAAVLQSESVTATKALDLRVIDVIAKDLPDLLQQIDGRDRDGKTLKTAGANIVEIPMALRERLFQAFARPEVMLILMLIATFGIIAELNTPGAILPGVAGAIALILALYLGAILPISVAGLALLFVALVLFIADLFAPSHGVLTFGGILAFFLGALMLFSRAEPAFHLSLAYIIPATGLLALFFLFVVGASLRAQMLPVRAGKETMLGKVAPAAARIDSSGGKVFVEGEYWNAISDVPIEPGQVVEIAAIDGLTLKVKPKR
ncbi:MAG TPA: nodulation protein NfeD [Candidatus Binatia bacterium]|nr:nodulation protein NfeD [Candidatus Binatia bacterium]